MGWDLSTASYDSVSFALGATSTGPRSVRFKPDGSKMYVLFSSTTVRQYTLSTPWDLSTASYDSVSKDFSAQGSSVQGFYFKDDGTKIYVIIGSNNTVFQYSLSTAWNVSTASYDSVSLSGAAQDSAMLDITFKPDGSILYLTGTTNNRVYQYTVSTPWDLSTASYASKQLTFSTQNTSPMDVAFKSDGTKLYMLGAAGTQKAFQYTLSTAWDVSTGSFDAVEFSVNAQDTAAASIDFKPDGTKLYMVGSANDTVYQYSVAGGSRGWVVGSMSLN